MITQFVSDVCVWVSICRSMHVCVYCVLWQVQDGLAGVDSLQGVDVERGKVEGQLPY